MRYFDKESVVQINVLSKKELRDLIKSGMTLLDVKKKYQKYSLSNKSKVILDENKNILFFTYYNKNIKLCEYFDETKDKKVIVDDGAIKPLERGADLMIPGILKFLDKQPDFKKDDVVYIEINSRLFGVGIAQMCLSECVNAKTGVGIEILYLRDGILHKIIK
ncbi:hypothetical protein ECANGB1_311 [Enterospora canceri]|uniref:PUA domain-containing protein n=1 Tax=Enterospora canceri TaxID=1081671 RepID=A0A1Y1S874_9MICR|nr:hypothetical protein ECANGB1_311 [Enterospora canceri]